MKVAVVTGATSGIGFEICRKLLSIGYKVYGIGRDFSKNSLEHKNFIKVALDITHTGKLVEKLKQIRRNEKIYVLINSAGVGYFGLHEELNPKKIHEMIAVNLEAPIIISNIFLRDLKKNGGFIINISSVTAKDISTHAACYGATKAGISHFSNSLFYEGRKMGLKVITIHPDITKTHFYDKANFREGDAEESYLTPQCIANLVETIITQNKNTVITDITVRPQKHMIKRKR